MPLTRANALRDAIDDLGPVLRERGERIDGFGHELGLRTMHAVQMAWPYGRDYWPDGGDYG
jgi:hypothetical protein